MLMGLILGGFNKCVVVDTNLSWNTHIHTVVSKANRVLWLLKRALGYGAPSSVSKKLYLSFVRSLLEYCPQVWSGTTKHNIIAIERVQISATKCILGYPETGYKERLEELDILPLSYRREIVDTCFLFKCLNAEYNVEIFDFVSALSDGTRSTPNNNGTHKLKPVLCRTEGFKRSYFNRVVHTWNLLPEQCRLSSDTHSFKKNVNDFFYNERAQHFNADNVCTWRLKCLCPCCHL